MPKRLSMNVSKLVQRDLRSCPVWEFVAEPEGEETEEFVVPRPDIKRLTPRDVRQNFILIVLSELVFADGTRRLGFLTPLVKPSASSRTKSVNSSPLGTFQPVVFSGSRQVQFWLGSHVRDSDVVRAYQRLGRRRGSVFPIAARSLVPVSGGVLAEATIPGFLHTTNEFVFTL
jgi:hypothetical protein